MYKITIQTLNGNEKTLYYPGNDEFTVLSASLSLKVGNAGELKFTVPQSNPLYNEIVDRSIITIYEDNTEIWRGDIQDISQNFDKSLEVYALEDLAWLGDETVPMVAVENQTYAQRFSTVMANYNDNQPAKRQFQPGIITSVTTSNFCNWQPLYEETLLECIRRCIADNGYLKVRRVTNNGTVTRYIDILLLEDYGQQAQQAIRFGSNLLDFVKEIDNTNFLNVLYPYGKETEENLYGDVMRRIEGTPIQNDASIAAFGRHARTVVFETDNMANLDRLALAYLNRYSQPSLKIKAKAIDLGNIEEISRMHLGDSVRIIAEPFGIDQWDYITNQALDLLNIANNQIELSDAVRVSTLTSQVASQGEEIKDTRTPASVLDEAKRNAWSIIEGDNGGIVTFDVNGNEQIVGIHIANNLDINQATKAWGWNVNGLVYLHRTYPSDEWQVGIAMTMDGQIVADYITTGEMSADRINGGHIRANLITALNGTTAVGNNTLADFATKATTIVDVDVEYAKNQSSTSAPTSGWSTSSPQWEEGYYIWQRTKTTDGNNQASYSTPVCIQGAKGEKGDDGNSISSVTITYGSSRSPSTVPTTWYNNPPTVAQGDYLWTRTIIDYTDTSVQDTVSYTYSRQGEDGQQGQAGTSVTVSSIQYQEGTSATSAPTGTWSNNPVTVAQGNYLWTKTTFSNGSIAYGIARQGEDGTDGTDGSDGVGVSAIVEQYYLSTSDQSPTGGSWSTNQPAWVEGKYIWTRSHVTWTDGTTTDTSPVLAQAINGANQAVQDLDDDLDQNGVFNRLIGGDTAQGIVLNNGKLYLRGEYLEAGAITIGGSTFANNPTIVVKNASNTQIGSWTKDGISITGGSINGTTINVPNASSPLFSVNSNGNMNAQAGQIGGLTLANGALSAIGTRELFPSTYFTFKSGASNKIIGIFEFIPAYLGITGSAPIFTDYYLDASVTRLMFYYQYKGSDGGWYNVDYINVTDSSGWHTDQQLWAPDYTSDMLHRIAVRCSKTSSLTVKFACNFYVKNANLTNVSSTGIIGKFKGNYEGLGDFASATIGGNTYNSEGINADDTGVIHEENDRYISLNHEGLYLHEDSSNYLNVTNGNLEAQEGDHYIQIYSSIHPTFKIGYDSENYLNLSLSSYNPSLSAECSGTVFYVNWQNGSDRRIKENITDLDNKLSVDFINKTEPKRFKYIKNDGIHYGMIAQDARELLDELGETDAVLEFSPTPEQEDDFRAIRYDEYIPHLINYVKDLRAEIEALKNIINTLKEDK